MPLPTTTWWATTIQPRTFVIHPTLTDSGALPPVHPLDTFTKNFTTYEEIRNFQLQNHKSKNRLRTTRIIVYNLPRPYDIWPVLLSIVATPIIQPKNLQHAQSPSTCEPRIHHKKKEWSIWQLGPQPITGMLPITHRTWQYSYSTTEHHLVAT